MGYTHYWYRKPKIDDAAFKAISADFQRIVLALDDMGVRLGDGFGENVPVITDDRIEFNGLSACGHPENTSVVIPWPAKNASGVSENSRLSEAGSWFAGTLLQSRCCNGDCSYETFSFPAEVPARGADFESDTHPGLYFDCCKTAYRPYDVAVTAFLIIAKHHLGDSIQVRSDGEDEHWQDAKWLCYVHLGYGPDYLMTVDGLKHKDDSRTAEQLKAELQEQARPAKEAAENAKKQTFDAEVARLRSEPKYKHLKPANSDTEAIANIRAELKRAFPATKFSVRKDHYSCCNITWTDGPRTDEVEAITGRYKGGYFDGMTDCYEYSHSPWNTVFGSLKYIFTRREYSATFLRVASDMIAKHYHLPAFEIKAESDGRAWIPYGNSQDADRNRQLVYDFIEQKGLFTPDTQSPQCA